MRKNLIFLMITGIVAFILVTSCKKEKEYDWKSIAPGKQLITGPDSIKGNDSTTYECLAIPRGGSKYMWEVLRGPVKIIEVDTINKDPLHYHPYRIMVTANSLTDTSAAIKVREITWAGDTGISDTLEIKKIACYKPFDNALFTGKYKCYEINITNGDTLVPYDANFSYEAGVTFVIDDFHRNGWQQKYIVSKDKNETITLVPHTPPYIYNDLLVVAKGKGYYSLCNGTITVNYFLINFNTNDTIEAGTDRFIRQ